MRVLLRVTTLALVVAVGACANQKAPAEAAVGAAQTAYTAISADAMKYVPEQAQSVEAGIAAAQAKITSGDYAEALASAQTLPAQISTLGTAVAAKKMEMSQAWAAMSATVPAMVASLTTQVETLAKTRKLPAGVTKENLEAAKTGLAAATQSWTAAMASAQAGDFTAATKEADNVKATVMQLMMSLKMPMAPM